MAESLSTPGPEIQRCDPSAQLSELLLSSVA